MQPSEQQPSGEAIRPDAEREIVEEQKMQPLHEYPSAEGVLAEPAPFTRVLSQDVSADMPLHEAIRRGLVYPPPPSYYQEMASAPQALPLPLPPSINAAPAQPLPYQYGPQYGAAMRPAGAPLYAPPLVSPPPRKSRKWIWIVVSIASAVLLIGCGLCGWGAYSIFSSAYQQVSGSLNVVNDFYSNLQAQRYTQAYNDLAPQGSISNLTPAQFTQQAQMLDQKDGSILSFTPNQPNFSTAPGQTPNLSHFTMTVNIQRSKLTYTVLLTLSEIGGTWKIVDFDRL